LLVKYATSALSSGEEETVSDFSRRFTRVSFCLSAKKIPRSFDPDPHSDLSKKSSPLWLALADEVIFIRVHKLKQDYAQGQLKTKFLL